MDTFAYFNNYKLSDIDAVTGEEIRLKDYERPAQLVGDAWNWN